MKKHDKVEETNSPKLPGWARITVLGVFAGILDGGRKEAFAYASEYAKNKLRFTLDKDGHNRFKRDAEKKRFIQMTRGSIIGGLRLGFICAEFNVLRKLLAYKRGHEDILTVAGAGLVTFATCGVIRPVYWRASNVFLGLLLGDVFLRRLGDRFYSKLVKKANEQRSVAYSELDEGGEAKSEIGAGEKKTELE